MKKLLALVLALMLVLLTSCEMFVPAPPESQRPDFGLPSLPAGTKDPAPTQTADPTADEYGFTIFPEGNYLANPKFDTDEFLPDYDSDPSFLQFLGTYHRGLTQTNQTIYSFCQNKENDIIMYTDKSTGISGPLCGKPECLHSDDTCNAYVDGYCDGLDVYQGKLYWIDASLKIRRMNLDGTDRETVNELDYRECNSNRNNPTTVFHRGYAYFAESNHAAVINGEVAATVTIKAVPVDGGDPFTVMERAVDGQGPSCLIRLIANDLYIMVYSFNYSDPKNQSGTFSTIELYKWDSKTRRAECLANLKSNDVGIQFEGREFWPVPGDGIYIQGSYFTETDSGIQGGFGVCKYSFASGMLEELPPFEYSIFPGFTRNYVIVDDNNVVFAYDYDGRLAFRSESLEEHPLLALMGADDAFIYYYCYAFSEGTAYFIAVPLDGGEIIAIG